jgi:hypothetical protein
MTAHGASARVGGVTHFRPAGTAGGANELLQRSTWRLPLEVLPPGPV